VADYFNFTLYEPILRNSGIEFFICQMPAGLSASA